MAKVRVGINGLGTIGRRIAEAIQLQDDMELVGAVKTRPDVYARQTVARGISLYAPSQDVAEAFDSAGVRVSGTLEDLLDRVDVIVDATPGGVGERYARVYREKGVKALFQGGEKAHVAEASFSTLCNYEESLGKNSLRVVSCNTTGLLRLICTLHREIGVKSVRAVLVRRAADPREVKKGPINSINISPIKLPSHHALDVKEVLPWLDIKTAAVVVPTTLMHVHNVTLKLSRDVSKDEVVEALERAPRIMLLDSEATGIKSTAQIMDAARYMRPRGDVPELVVFADSISVDGAEVMLWQAVHQESIVVPENIDAIRAVARLAETMEETLRKTDSSLGLTKSLY